MKKDNDLKFVLIKGSPFGDMVLEKLLRLNEKPDLVIDNLDEEKISKVKPDLIITAGFYKNITEEILKIPKYGCLGIHPSLLPRWKGFSPVEYAILNGDREIGATIVSIETRTDQGPIIVQRKTGIGRDETSEDIYLKLAEIGVRLFLEIFPKWQRGMIKPYPQDPTETTFSKKLDSTIGRINWKKTAQDISREIRAFYLWPRSYTFWNRQRGWFRKTEESLRLTISKARVVESKRGKTLTYLIGETSVGPRNNIFIQCGRGLSSEGGGDFLVVEKIQLEEEEPMTSQEFLVKYPDFIGVIFK